MPRIFQESDLYQCAKLFVSTFSHAPWSETWDRHMVRERLEQIVNTLRSLGVVVGYPCITGSALGFSEPWHEESHFYLKGMCIDHAQQRQGLGSSVMAFLSQQIRALGAQRLYVLTARGEMSEAFYTKIGFYANPKTILMAQRFESNSEQDATSNGGQHSFLNSGLPPRHG